MKIALISPLPPPSGGIASWTLDYVEYAKKMDIETQVINTALVGKRAIHRTKSKNLLCEIKRSCYIVKELRRVIKSKEVDIVHINTVCSIFGMIRDIICLANCRRIPIVVQCHCNVEDWIGKSEVSLLLFKIILHMADRVIVLNKKSQDFIKNKVKKESVCIPNFIKCVHEKEHSTNNEVRQVVYVGQVRKKKGIEEIISVAKDMPHITFNLIGPIEEEIKKCKKSDNVVLRGEILHEDIAEELEKADVFLFPSYTEGFSMALLEAMNIGLPVIATDVGANSDMIENKGGILVSSKNSQQIVEAINALNPESIRERMSNWNQQKVKKYYTIDKVMKRLDDIYKELLA